MPIPEMPEALKRIQESIQRKKGSFEIASVGDDFSLSVGSYRAVKLPEGFIISLKLSREQLEYLKAQCAEALARKG